MTSLTVSESQPNTQNMQFAFWPEFFVANADVFYNFTSITNLVEKCPRIRLKTNLQGEVQLQMCFKTKE